MASIRCRISKVDDDALGSALGQCRDDMSYLHDLALALPTVMPEFLSSSP
jgi:hypothetical protein